MFCASVLAKGKGSRVVSMGIRNRLLGELNVQAPVSFSRTLSTAGSSGQVKSNLTIPQSLLDILLPNCAIDWIIVIVRLSAKSLGSNGDGVISKLRNSLSFVTRSAMSELTIS